jgi:HEAT repeat protein
MTTPAGSLSEFASVLLLLRDHPELKEEQRQAFKRFAAGLGGGDHVLKVTPSGFLWNGVDVPVGRAELIGLHDQLRGLGVGEVRLPRGLMTSTLVSLMRILASPPGTYGSFDHLIARLDAAGCGAATVLPLPPEGVTTLPNPVPAADPLGPGVVRPLWEVSPAEGRRTEPPAADLRKKVDDEGRLTALGPDALTEAKVGMIHFATMQNRALNPLDELVDRLGHTESDRGATELLNQIMAAAEFATRQGDWGELVRAAHGLITLEGRQPKDAESRSYGIALRRMLPRSVLEQVARLCAYGNHKAEAAKVLQRMGADGTEVLLAALVNSEDVAERRGYFSALKEMTEGGELLVHMLSHDQWYVVRNVADLCGELRQESAVHALARQMGHSDERVRRAVAGALAKIGGIGAVEPLRRALKDPAAPVRLQAAQDLDGRRNRNLAMSLAVAAEEEGKSDVQREIYLALGRIASNEALQALRKAAEPGGKLFRRKPAATRLAAVEGLKLAGPSAANVLKELLQDEDSKVRTAVEQALQGLWQ